ncbi:hypothetical protein N7507_006350 [Penicillium longicatenatum]|nr:hypothetical protein N7507_006350 [Penicillium longicatenatum]
MKDSSVTCESDAKIASEFFRKDLSTPSGSGDESEVGEDDPPIYHHDQCFSAMEGKKVPENLDCLWSRRATIRGIRTSLEFAQSRSVVELCDEIKFPEFSRARNARLIMSNIIPELESPAVHPYCIWYPEFANENTYRELVRRHPLMRYQVGRACAGAGYTDLYKELNLLPDTSIAEEARESKHGAEIYQMIMSASQRYAIMNDYSRSINLDAKTPTYLNGDMKPRKRVLPPHNVPDISPDDIDIEEDGFIGLEKTEPDTTRFDLGPEQAKLLWMPLPLDLPILEKDILTQTAAYDGNVERYVRLMHPRRLRTEYELFSILRGIHHNTMFARWWADQIEIQPRRIVNPGKFLTDDNETELSLIRTAINA